MTTNSPDDRPEREPRRRDGGDRSGFRGGRDDRDRGPRRDNDRGDRGGFRGQRDDRGGRPSGGGGGFCPRGEPGPGRGGDRKRAGWGKRENLGVGGSFKKKKKNRN